MKVWVFTLWPLSSGPLGRWSVISKIPQVSPSERACCQDRVPERQCGMKGPSGVPPVWWAWRHGPQPTQSGSRVQLLWNLAISSLPAWKSKPSHDLSEAAWAQGSTQSCSPLCSLLLTCTLWRTHPSRAWMPSGAYSTHEIACSLTTTLEGKLVPLTSSNLAKAPKLSTVPGLDPHVFQRGQNSLQPYPLCLLPYS